LGSQARGYFQDRGGQMYFDLWAANRDQLVSAGLKAENIHFAGACTMCWNDLFPSFRKEAAEAERFIAAIAISL